MREKKPTIFYTSDKICPLLRSSFINNSKNSTGIVCQLNEVINVFIIWHHFIDLCFAGIIIADK